VLIRDEAPGDVDQIRRLVDAAFESSGESDLIASLRSDASPLISLVAEEAGSVIGHILFSPVTIGDRDALLFGLAPMAVSPGRQRNGVGSALVREGLSRCRNLSAAGVVVLGHAAYYPRFGFTKAADFGISSEYEVPDEIFMAIECTEGSLGGIEGQVRYHPAFNAV